MALGLGAHHPTPFNSGFASARRSCRSSCLRICHRSRRCGCGFGSDARFGACFANHLRASSSSRLSRWLRVIVELRFFLSMQLMKALVWA
jgi:hypothetical protein